MKVIIRTPERLDRMGEIGDAIKLMAKKNAFEGKTYPVIYQFAKGATGESLNHTPDENIGTVKNVQLTEEGLIGDVSVIIPMKNAQNFDGKTIDNLVVTKNPAAKKKEDMYNLVHFVVYNLANKRFQNKQKSAESKVQKMYVAPKEVLGADMNDGDTLAKEMESWEKTKQQVIAESNYKQPSVRLKEKEE